MFFVFVLFCFDYFVVVFFVNTSISVNKIHLKRAHLDLTIHYAYPLMVTRSVWVMTSLWYHFDIGYIKVLTDLKGRDSNVFTINIMNLSNLETSIYTFELWRIGGKLKNLSTSCNVKPRSRLTINLNVIQRVIIDLNCIFCWFQKSFPNSKKNNMFPSISNTFASDRIQEKNFTYFQFDFL